jgi:hypothetical protein
MKHQLLLFFLLITIEQVSAQTISRTVFPTNGINYTDSNIQVSATIGETFTQTFLTNDIIASQGFQQVDSLSALYLYLTFFIQGYYIDNYKMKAVLYNSGIGSDTTITDTVEVRIINSTPPYLVKQSIKSLLHTDGKLNCKLNPMLLGGSYYISLHHRNIIETWSANPIVFNRNTYYDFSISEGN